MRRPPVDNALGYRFFVREQPGDSEREFDTGLYTVVHNGLMDMSAIQRTLDQDAHGSAGGCAIRASWASHASKCAQEGRR